MTKEYSFVVDSGSLESSCTVQTKHYASELLNALPAARPAWNFAPHLSTFAAAMTFNIFVDSKVFDQTTPRIVFIDHLLPLGLKTSVFDMWSKEEQDEYRKALDSISLQPTLVFTSSEWTRRDVLTWSGYSPHHVIALTAGVSSDFVGPPEHQTPYALLKEVGIDGRFILSWIDDERFSGLELTLAAFIENKALHPDLSLLICYSQETEIIARLQAWISENKRADVIFYKTADRARIKQLLAGAACFSHPVSYDGFNLKILDAMSQACPVLTTRSSSFPEVCADTALYTNFNDAIELAKNMHAILSDAGTRSNLKNRTFVRSEQFRWGRVGEKAASAIEAWLPEASVPLYEEIKL